MHRNEIRDTLLSLYRLGKIVEESGHEDDSAQNELRILEKGIHGVILGHASRWLRNDKNPVALVDDDRLCAECGKEVPRWLYNEVLTYSDIVVCDGCKRLLLAKRSL